MGILAARLNDGVEQTDGASRVAALEEGSVVFVPARRFELRDAERRLLSPVWLKSGTKNISFDPHTGVVRGSRAVGSELEEMRAMLRRFSEWGRDLMLEVFAPYGKRLHMGLASFRPAEIAGRSSSWRKDDTRLHVDAFPSRPLQGRRIIRLFANVGEEVRRWNTGEPFEQVARRFLPGIGGAWPGSSWLLRQLRITRGRRTAYDHYMLRIHDAMKLDCTYQAEVKRAEIDFPPGATWACYTDLVSHAALSGQFALEQTFYLKVSAMQEPARSPLRILEDLLGRGLV